MDAYEATKEVYARVQSMDPEHAAQIMAVLLSQDHGDKEMIRLAFGPQSHLAAVIARARSDIALSPLSAPPSRSSLPFARTDEFGGPAGRRCLYFEKGYCKSGAACRFAHGFADDAAAGAKCGRPPSQLMANAVPFLPAAKGVSFLQQQQQSESQGAAAAAAAALLLDEYNHIGRSSRMALASPGARQIYLTFPADSTFSEDDVSNYFSIFGPVQDVRIPYQQKRMFGFVTFVHPETVKMILAKGNPHFVCESRVLVKPYKEKIKMANKKQTEFIVCTSPTGFIAARDPLELPQLGQPRLLYDYNQEARMMRRKLEEQHAADLQQAIELQERRFMGLQLLELKPRIKPQLGDQDKNIAASIAAPVEPKQGNAAALSANETASNEGCKTHESNGLEHTLPESPFASPTKAGGITDHPLRQTDGSHLMPSPTFPPPNLVPYNCFFQMPSFFPGHGAIGM